MIKQLRERRLITGARALFVDFMFLGGANGMASILSLATFALLARHFTPAELGHYNMVMVVVGALSLSTTWLTSTGTRFGREEFLSHHSIRKTFWGQALVSVFCLAVLMILVKMFSQQISDYLQLNGRTPKLLMFLVLAVTSLPFWQNMFRAVENMRMFSLLPVLRNAMFLTAVVIVLATGGHLPVVRSLELWVIASLMPAMLSLFLLKPALFWPPALESQWMKSMIRYSWPLTFGAVTIYWTNCIDLVVVKAKLSAEDLGYYAAATACYRVLVVLPDLLSHTLLPVIVSFRAGKKGHFNEYYLRHTVPQIAVILSIFCLIMMALAPLIIVLLYGVSYQKSLPAMTILIGASLFTGVKKLFVPILGAYDMTGLSTAAGLGTAFLTTVLTMALVPRLGLEGAAIAILLTQLAESGWLSFYLWRKFRISPHGLWFTILTIAPLGAFLVAHQSLLWRVGLCVMGVSLLAAGGRFKKLFQIKDLEILDKLHAPGKIKSTARNILRLWGGIPE